MYFGTCMTSCKVDALPAGFTLLSNASASSLQASSRSLSVTLGSSGLTPSHAPTHLLRALVFVSESLM